MVPRMIPGLIRKRLNQFPAVGLVELTPLLVSELPDVDLDLLWRDDGYPDGGVLGGVHFPSGR